MLTPIGRNPPANTRHTQKHKYIFTGDTVTCSIPSSGGGDASGGDNPYFIFFLFKVPGSSIILSSASPISGACCSPFTRGPPVSLTLVSTLFNSGSIIIGLFGAFSSKLACFVVRNSTSTGDAKFGAERERERERKKRKKKQEHGE